MFMVPGTAIYVIFHATVILKKSSGQVLFQLNQDYLRGTAVILQNYMLLDFFVVPSDYFNMYIKHYN